LAPAFFFIDLKRDLRVMMIKNNKNIALIATRARLFFLIIFSLLCVNIAHAQVKLATVFANNMVLQRDLPINIWGSANKYEKIKIILNGKTFLGQANKTGAWLITLPSQHVATKQTISIVGENTTQFNTIELGNIAFGDVWLASGQSNMEFKLKKTLKKFPQEDKLEQYPDIRQFKVVRNYHFKKPLDDIEKGYWLEANKETVGDFSAVAWFFAKDLYQRYQIPIGIISSSVGATPIESWMSYESLKTFPKAQALAYKLANDEYIKQLQNEYAQERRNWREKNNEPTKKLPFMLKHRTSLDFKPVGFYNGMIAPLAKMKFSGVIWYQGESNTAEYQNYSSKFSTMINNGVRYLTNRNYLSYLFNWLISYIQIASRQKVGGQIFEQNKLRY